jgi:hypothetical protein
VIGVAAAFVALLVDATVTQSPFASDDSETAEIFENRVEVAHATVVVPVVVCTFAPADVIDRTLPEAALKLPRNDWPAPLDDDAEGDAAGAAVEELELPPHALAATAIRARPHAESSRGWRLADVRGRESR